MRSCSRSGHTPTTECARTVCPARELWDLAVDFWPEGFADHSRDEFDVLLEEMVNLEVFAVSDGRFRLPAVNVLRLLGDSVEIGDRLIDEIAAGGMPDTPNPERLRRPLVGTQDARRSPLTFGDERSLLGRDGPPVRVVFGTAATHVERLKQSLEACAASGEWREITFDISTGLNLQEIARRYRRGEIPRGRVIHAGRLTVLDTEGPDAAIGQFRALLTVLAERGVADRVAVVAIADHTTAPEWVSLVDGMDLDLPGEARTVALKRWDAMQLEVWLDELDLPVPNEADRSAILGLTGGWPALTERFAGVKASGRSVDETLRSMRDDTTFLEEAAARLQVDDVPLAREVVEVMDEFGDPLDVSTLASLLEGSAASLPRVYEAVQTLWLQDIVQRVGEGYVLEAVAARALRHGKT